MVTLPVLSPCCPQRRESAASTRGPDADCQPPDSRDKHRVRAEGRSGGGAHN